MVQTDCIARISPKDGEVLGWIVLDKLRFASFLGYAYFYFAIAFAMYMLCMQSFEN